jgi:uncharacterized RDD family membrane protein YckC
MPAADPVMVALEWEGVDGSPLPPDAKVVDAGLERFNQAAADFTTSLRFACLLLFNRKRRALHDFIAGTIVVRVAD